MPKVCSVRSWLCLALLTSVLVTVRMAAAQPASDVLRRGNEAANAGDWSRVRSIVDPLFTQPLVVAQRAEAHRLAGLAAFFLGDRELADRHLFAYLMIDLDARFDPSVYPPDVLGFVEHVKVRHAAELRARRGKPKAYWLFNLVPPIGQYQNGDRTKMYVIGGLLGGFAIAHVTSYAVLRSWCRRAIGSSGESVTCDRDSDRAGAAKRLRALNLLSGIGLLVTYGYGVYDGVANYRRARERPTPYVDSASGGAVFGVAGVF